MVQQLFIAISYPEPAIFRGRIESSGIIHNRKPEILAFLLDCYIPFCINNQSDSPGFMDYPRALDSSPEDRWLGVRDCFLLLLNWDDFCQHVMIILNPPKNIKRILSTMPIFATIMKNV